MKYPCVDKICWLKRGDKNSSQSNNNSIILLLPKSNKLLIKNILPGDAVHIFYKIFSECLLTLRKGIVLP